MLRSLQLILSLLPCNDSFSNCMQTLLLTLMFYANKLTVKMLNKTETLT